MLEREFGVNGEEANRRHEARKWLPRIIRPPKANYSIVQALRMKGKTIEKVETGSREEIKGVHASEAIIIYFTDGSIMGLQTGSNVGNLGTNENRLHPEDFNVDLAVNWVPDCQKADPRCGLLLIGAYLILRNTISHLGAPLWTHIV
jgi:hypothetical protein